MNYGSISTTGTTFSITPDFGERPPKSPKGLIATQAVQTKGGWLGQVFVDKQIVFESAEPHDGSDEAIDEANQRVIAVITSLFAAEAPADS